jgi:hypothetical protein
MSDNKTLMKYMSDRNMGVLRGPSGSISDTYFWNRYSSNPPTDIPAKLAGASDNFSPWYGKRTASENWSMDIDSFYSVLNQIKATGMITVNYGYARYGTSANPVAQAAHMAADWVRYDKGRSKFWEIGNEVFGNWEAGYRIDKSLNKDNQPEYITGSLYGKHSLVFIDSMRKAAAEVGADIKIGLVLVEASSTGATWNEGVIAEAGDKADFYIIHSYYNPYNQNSTADVILNSYKYTDDYMNYVLTGIQNKNKSRLPLALTEYNIFAVSSKQQVSHINALHAALVMGEAIKTGYGAALRWDLANGWANGDDHGMFSYGDEPGVEKFAPRPAFYSMYFFRKYFGDVMVKNTVAGSQDIVVFSSKFKSGQAGVVIVNKGQYSQTARVNIENFKFGERYYTYTFTGGTDNGNFSRKIYVNGIGPSGVAGGPLNYEAIKANSSTIDTEVKVDVPGYSMVIMLAEPGDKTLVIDETYSGLSSSSILRDKNSVSLYPLPVREVLNIRNFGREFTRLEVSDLTGKKVIEKTDKITSDYSVGIDIPTGVYIVKLSNDNEIYTTRIMIEK